MDAPAYVEILQKTLLPFVHEVFPDRHRFMQENLWHELKEYLKIENFQDT